MFDTERAILASGTELNLRRGEYLFRRQQAAEYIFFLRAGKLELADDQHPARVFEGRACFLGLEEALLDCRHRFSARVLDSSAVVLAFEKTFLEELLHRDADAHRYFLLKLGERLGPQREFE